MKTSYKHFAIGIVGIFLTVLMALIINMFNNLPEPENCEVEFNKQPQTESLWRGTVHQTDTETNK